MRPGSTTTARRRHPPSSAAPSRLRSRSPPTHGLPIVIHARDREGETPPIDEVFEILDARAAGGAVILHCFLAPWRLRDAIERGWYCSFSGILTYPKSDALREAAAELPDELRPGRDRRSLPRPPAAARQAQ